MSLVAEQNTTKREVLEPGTYVARCYSVIDLGTQYSEKRDTESRKIRITFELPLELRVFDEEKGEQPMVLGREYTLSLAEKSHLRGDLVNRGLLTKDMAVNSGYDVMDLVGKEVMLSVGVVSKEGKDYNVINSTTALMKGVVCPPQINPSQTLELTSQSFSVEIYNSLPKFIKEKIQKSKERLGGICKLVEGLSIEDLEVGD